METPEDKSFNEVEKRSRVKQDILMHPSKEARLVAEVAVLTEVVRVLSERVAEMEAKQEQPYAHEAAMYSNDRMTVDPQTGNVSIGKQEQGSTTCDKPVAWMQDSIELYVQDRPSEYYTIPLYTTPPAAQPAQEPVAWMWVINGKPKTVSFGGANSNTPKEWTVLPLYTTPPQRTWVGLTDEERKDLFKRNEEQFYDELNYAEAIEAKLREKNYAI